MVNVVDRNKFFAQNNLKGKKFLYKAQNPL